MRHFHFRIIIFVSVLLLDWRGIAAAKNTVSLVKKAELMSAAYKFATKILAEEGRNFAFNNVKHALCVDGVFRRRVDRFISDASDQNFAIESIDQIMVAGLNCQALDYDKIEETTEKKVPENAPSAPKSATQSNDYCVTGLHEAGPNNFLVLRYQPILDPNGGWDPDIKLYNGERMTVLSASGAFYKVRLSSGREGYAARDKIISCDITQRPEMPLDHRGIDYCIVSGLSDVPPDNWLALRSQPNRSSYYPQNIKLRNGALLVLLDRASEWVHVRTKAGLVGWVSAQFTRC